MVGVRLIHDTVIIDVGGFFATERAAGIDRVQDGDGVGDIDVPVPIRVAANKDQSSAVDLRGPHAIQIREHQTPVTGAVALGVMHD